MLRALAQPQQSNALRTVFVLILISPKIDVKQLTIFACDGLAAEMSTCLALLILSNVAAKTIKGKGVNQRYIYRNIYGNICVDVYIHIYIYIYIYDYRDNMSTCLALLILSNIAAKKKERGGK